LRPPILLPQDCAVRRSPAILFILSLVLFACGSSSGPTTFDARPQADAASGTPDAPVSAPDAPVSTPDAPVSTPDAPVSTPDAPVSTPDAPVSTPDAPVSTPDARPDAAAAPDARPDAAAAPDARPADAGATAGCLPQCFVDINAALLASCPPELPCTSSGIDFQTFMFAVCYANGVKLVAGIDIATGTVNATFREADGDTCYSYVATATSESSAEISLRNRDGAQVARIVIPDTDDSDIQHYYCGANGPFIVDLGSPECEGVENPNPNDTSECPESDTCNP
jgi:hypothetical protein